MFHITHMYLGICVLRKSIEKLYNSIFQIPYSTTTTSVFWVTNGIMFLIFPK